MKPFLRIIFLLALCIYGTGKATAQYVTLPDTNFRNYLQSLYPSCFNSNNKLDTVCAATQPAASINVYNLNITDLTGVQYFKNLDSLDCSSNSLSSLPTLPPSLIYLNCDSNKLSTLPALPVFLAYLNCSFNYALGSLPTLPAFLTYLDCSYNSLSSLPALPASLILLKSSANSLANGLPALPDSLTSLSCYINNLSSLPALPASLTNIECESNKLTSLPALPASLKGLQCSYNNLSSLPALPASLTFLDCTANNIYCLPTLPNYLDELYATSNHIACIPNIPSFLIYMDSTFQICTDTSNPNGCTILSVTGNTSAASVQTIEVFPNPSTGIVTINCPFTATGITIAGMDGKTIYQISAGTTNYTIDLSGIAKGLYVAQVSSANGMVTQKVVIQ